MVAGCHLNPFLRVKDLSDPARMDFDALDSPDLNLSYV